MTKPDTSADAVERLATALDNWRGIGGEQFAGDFSATLRALLAERDKSRGMLGEAADDMQARIAAEYAGTEHYPNQARKKDRDMDLVRRIRALLEQHVAALEERMRSR